MDNIARACSALNHLDSGCPREEWVRIGMAAKEAGLSFDDFHDWSKNAGNYKGEADSRAAWKSFKESGGITAATLFHMALDKGWKDPFKVVSNSSNGKSQGKRREVSKTFHNEEQNNRVLEIWNRCVPATPAHEYIMRKQGRPDGLRVYPVDAPTLIIDGQNVAGYLVAPCLSDGIPQTLQFIPPGEGKKLNLGGASFNDGFFVVGEINEDTLKIYPTESIGNAWAIFQATGAPSVVFFGSSRTARVVKVLRTKYPKVNLTQVPDKGKESQAAEIASQFDCQWIELPHDKPSNYDVNDYAQEYGHDALAVLLTNVKAPEMRYKLLSGTDLFNAPPMRWMVQGIIPAEGLAALYGASGSGKSFLILDMAFAIAGGEAYWFGLRVTKAPVTYICLEGESGVGKRIKAWSIYCGKPVPNELRFVTQPFNLLGNDISELAKAIIAGSGTGGLVIIDTLNRAAPGADENSSIDMGNIIAAAKHLQSLIGGVVLLVHHTGKDTTKGLRGHSSLYAALDGAIEVIKTETRREWGVAKSKDDVTGNSNPFKLEIVPVGLDVDGHEITSCVALYDSSKVALQKKPSSLGCNQKIALEEIDRLLIISPHLGKDGTPTLSKCVAYDEALSNATERMPTDAKHRKSRAQSAIRGLVERKHVGMKGDWLWRID